MANEFKHKDIGAELTRAEFEGIDLHVLDAQATDDIIVAISATQLSRLAVAASRILGKKATGNLGALTAAEIRTIINVEDGAAADLTGAEIVTLLEALAAIDRLDHGAGLDGLGDDDHTQYQLKSLLTTQGDIIYASGASTWVRLAKGTDGHYLKQGATIPEWSEASKVIWKNASELVLTDINRTDTLNWTDLDLTAFTSANAKFAILNLKLQKVSWSSGSVYLMVRKNGTSPAETPVLGVVSFDVSDYVTAPSIIVGVDTAQVIEYKLGIGGTAQIHFNIFVLGYIE